MAAWLATAVLGCAAAAAEAPPGVDPQLEEVVVTARQDSLSSLKLALIAAEDRFYERWNELNDDDDLDVICRVEAPTGTRLTRRTCAPRVLDDATREQAMLLFAGAGLGGNVAMRNPGDLRQMAAAELRRRTLPLLETDAQLREALLQRAKLQQLYDKVRAEKFEDRRVVWD